MNSEPIRRTEIKVHDFMFEPVDEKAFVFESPKVCISTPLGNDWVQDFKAEKL